MHPRLQAHRSFTNESRNLETTMLPGVPCSASQSSSALNTAASTAANKHAFSAWQLRARMQSDRQGPASQNEEQDSFIGNIGRIKTHKNSYSDSPVSLTSRMHGAISQAQAGLGWLRHVMQDPEDVAAAAMGRMVSKEYGKHERSHTERHAWRSPRPSPPSSPTAAVPSPLSQQQQHVPSPAAQTAGAHTEAGSTGGEGEVVAVSTGSQLLSAADDAAPQQQQIDL